MLLEVGHRRQVSRQLDDTRRAAPVRAESAGVDRCYETSPGSGVITGEGVAIAFRKIGVGVAQIQGEDLVGEADLPNAVALNNAVISSGRMIGPVISGLLITYFGTAPSFFINAVSFGAIVLVLVMLDVTRLHPTRPVKREPGQVREGLSYIQQDRVLRLTVAAMSLIFIAAYNFRLWFRSWHPGCSAGQANCSGS